MPQHPTTWFKIQFEGGEIATFRSSALIPLDGLGKPLPGFGVEAKAAAASQRAANSAAPAQYPDDADSISTPPDVPSRRVLREHSGFQNYAVDIEIANLGRSTQRPRSLSIEPYGRGMTTGFRQYDNDANNPMFTTKTTEAERKIFNDFVEVAYASAYVPDCAQNTHDNGLLEHRALSSDGACTECRERKWRASFVGVGGGICWNQKCITSPIFGRMRSFSDPYNINISNNESNMSNVVSGSSTARDYMATAQNLVAAAAAAGGGGAKRHLSASVSVPVPIRVPHSAAMPGYVEKAHPVSPLESFGSKGTVRSVDSMASAHHSAFDVHRGRGAMPRVISSSSTSSVSSNSNSSSDMITDHRSTNSLHQLHQQQQQQDLSHTPGASDWEMGGKVVYATAQPRTRSRLPLLLLPLPPPHCMLHLHQATVRLLSASRNRVPTRQRLM